MEGRLRRRERAHVGFETLEPRIVLSGDPMAEAGGPYAGDEGSHIQLIGSGTGTIDTYAWDLDNNGSFETPGQDVLFAPSDDGIYTVALQVTGPGGSNIDTAQVTVNNLAPAAGIIGPAGGVRMSLPVSQSPGVDPVFTDVTAAAGVVYDQNALPNEFGEADHMTGGAAAGDFDNDGWVDLYVSRLNAGDILYRNKGDGTFEVHTTFPVLDTNGAAWGDIDNDGDLDLYVISTKDTRFYLYMNNGDGTFTEDAVARGADLTSPLGRLHRGQSVTFGDYDNDGYLDVYTSEWGAFSDLAANSKNRLLHNVGSANPGHFVDVTDAAGVNVDFVYDGLKRAYGFSPRFTDLDGDGFVDLAIASDFGTSKLFWNDGDGTFTNGTLAAAVGTDENGMGSTIGDINGDGLMDWFVTSIYDLDNPPNRWGSSGNHLYLNLGDRHFVDATNAYGVRQGYWGWGTSFWDYDNDTDNDLVMTNGYIEPGETLEDEFEFDPMRLWRNEGFTQMTELSAAAGITSTGSGKGLLTFDYDKDGDLDLFVVNNGEGGILYRNDGGNNNDWLRVETIGTQSNRDGFGAFITVTPEMGGPSQVFEVNAGTHFLAQSEPTAHFGLGDGTDPVDRVVIEWPSGITQVFVDVPRNSTLVAIESSEVFEPGQSQTFTLVAEDPGADDQADDFTFDIDWDGDSVVDETIVGPSGTQVNHAFAMPGLVPTIVTATDKDSSASADATHTNVITGFALVPDEVTPALTNLVFTGTQGKDTYFFTGGGQTVYAMNMVQNGIEVLQSSVYNGVTGRIIGQGLDGDDEVIAVLVNDISLDFDAGMGNDNVVGTRSGDTILGGAGDDIIVGFLGNDSLDGGADNDVLSGVKGDDTLTGAAGRDILLGGLGIDSLDGGTGEDILLTGKTDYDIDLLALDTLRTEWVKNEIFENRVSVILGGSPYKFLPGTTVDDDGSADTATGGTGKDWFLYNFIQDILNDLELNDEETDLNI